MGRKRSRETDRTSESKGRCGTAFRLGALSVFTAAVLSLHPAPAGADGSFVDLPDLTFVGATADGATITVTVKDDLSAVLRLEVEDLVIEKIPGFACGGAVTRATAHYSPPIQVTSGSFSVSAVVKPLSSSVVVDGVFDAGGNLSGSAWFLSVAPPALTCESPAVVWTSPGPIATAPDASDLRFDGAVEGGAAGITFWMDSTRTSITAAVVDGLAVPPCTDIGEPVSIRTFFEPPSPVASADGSFSLVVATGVQPAGLRVDGVVYGDGTATGTVAVFLLDGSSCSSSWSAALDLTDTDRDGCLDPLEAGPEAKSGGQRNPKDFWDFLDVWTGTPPERDGAVSVGDILAVVKRFGASQDPPPTEQEALAEALTTPDPAPAYHASFDRGDGSLGTTVTPPDGVISAGDIAAVVSQFGHSCL